MDATVHDHLYGAGAAPVGGVALTVDDPPLGDQVDLRGLPGYHDPTLQPKPTAKPLFPEDFDRYGGLSRQEFYDEYYDRKHGWRYPPRDGFDGDPVPNTLEVGDVIDRFGDSDGKCASPAGTPYPQRSVPPNSLSNVYTQYRVRKPLPSSVREGIVA